MFVRTSGTWVFIETRSCLISMAKVGIKNKASMGFRMPFSDIL